MLTSGNSAWMARAASTPPISGMLTSMVTTSGRRRRTVLIADLAVGGLTRDLDVRLLLELKCKPISHDRMVVHEDDPDFSGWPTALTARPRLVARETSAMRLDARSSPRREQPSAPAPTP